MQNWYPGDAEGRGGIYNFVTKRGDCRGDRSKISWTQVETGSAITWKYPSCILRGDNSRGEFYSIAISNGRQQVDSGTKMIHLGKDTTSRIISKGISAGHSQNTYRGLVSAHRKATNARNFTICDSPLSGENSGAHTVPYIEAKTSSAQFEHEATTSKISEDQMFYCRQRGLSDEEATALIVNGFVGMTEGTDNLVLEHLRVIRGDIAKMRDTMSTMGAEITAMRQQLAAVVTLQDHDHGDIASLKVRVDRIERRLELTD